MIERDVKKYVKEIVKEIAPNSYCFMPVQTGMGAVDLDLIFDVAGYSLRVETKRGGLQPKASQLFTIKGLDKAGTPVLIIDESNIEDVAYVTNLLLDHKQIEALEYARENRADYCK